MRVRQREGKAKEGNGRGGVKSEVFCHSLSADLLAGGQEARRKREKATDQREREGEGLAGRGKGKGKKEEASIGGETRMTRSGICRELCSEGYQSPLRRLP